MAEDPLSNEGKVATIMGAVELVLACTPDPEQQRTLLEFTIARLQSRLPAAKQLLARIPTPAPRRPSGTIARVDVTLGNTHPDKER